MGFPSTPFANSSFVENSQPKKENNDWENIVIPNFSYENPFSCDLWDNLCLSNCSEHETDLCWTNADIYISEACTSLAYSELFGNPYI